MASQTFQAIEKAMTNIIASTLPQVMTKLKAIANDAPNDPAPHLAMAITNGSFWDSDLTECKQHLADAGKILIAGASRPHNAEWDFSQTLYDVITSELDLLEAKITSGPSAPLGPAVALKIRQAKVTSQKGQAKMAALVAQLNSALVNTIYAAIQVLAPTNSIRSTAFRNGKTVLNGLEQAKGPTADLAGYFLYYGHRKAKNYTNAIKVAQNITNRNPNSVLAKRMLGRANILAGKIDVAVAEYQKAVAIAPNDPFALMNCAEALQRAGKLGDAKVMLQKVKTLDPGSKLTPFINQITTIK
jgi:tetratricopeptide (TPR) repeat protein